MTHTSCLHPWLKKRIWQCVEAARKDLLQWSWPVFQVECWIAQVVEGYLQNAIFKC
jgi:hypothetical protein